MFSGILSALSIVAPTETTSISDGEMPASVAYINAKRAGDLAITSPEIKTLSFSRQGLKYNGLQADKKVIVLSF